MKTIHHPRPMKRSPALRKLVRESRIPVAPSTRPVRTKPLVLGDSFCNIACGQCGHESDYADFTPIGGRLPEFTCPACGHAWGIHSGEVEKRIALHGGGTLEIRAKTVETIQRPVIAVPIERLRMGIFGFKEGDIIAAYTADQQPKIRKPFVHAGHYWAEWGSGQTRVSFFGECNKATPLLPLTDETARIERKQYAYRGTRVTWKGAQWVCGDDTDFINEPLGIGAVLEIARHQYAYGGMFAVKAGSYHGLLHSYLLAPASNEFVPNRMTAIERIALETDLACDALPQTQQAMRALIEGK